MDLFLFLDASADAYSEWLYVLYLGHNYISVDVNLPILRYLAVIALIRFVG